MSEELEVLLGHVRAAWDASDCGRLFAGLGVSPKLLAKAGHAACALVDVVSAVEGIRVAETEAAAVERLTPVLVEMWMLGVRVGMGHQADLRAAE